MRRPILESGKAYKTVFLAQAPPSVTSEELEMSLTYHRGKLISELAKQGKLVTNVRRTVVGWGDVRLEATWVVLGEKETKKARRGKTGAGKGGTGLSAVQTGDQENPVHPEVSGSQLR